MRNNIPDILPENLAVILIDMQDYFIDSNEKRNLIPNQLLVLNFCRIKNIPVAVFEYRNRGETTTMLKKEIVKFSPENICTFIKRSDDAFSVEDFDGWLKEKNIQTLLLMGINACFCVYDTANSAIKNGYKIMTSDTLIAGYDNDYKSIKTHDWYMENSVSVRESLFYFY